MSKRKQRTKQLRQIQQREQKANEKPIYVNFYTLEDDEKIQTIIKTKTDWTIDDIKQALPYEHTEANIENYLLRYLTQEEINNHKPKQEEINNHKPKQRVNNILASKPWSLEEDYILVKHFIEIELDDEKWNTILPDRSYKARYSRAYRLHLSGTDAWTKEDIITLQNQYGKDDNILTKLSKPYSKERINNMIHLLRLDERKVTMLTEPKTNNDETMIRIIIELNQLLDNLITNNDNITMNVHIDFNNGIILHKEKNNNTI